MKVSFAGSVWKRRRLPAINLRLSFDALCGRHRIVVLVWRKAGERSSAPFWWRNIRDSMGTETHGL